MRNRVSWPTVTFFTAHLSPLSSSFHHNRECKQTLLARLDRYTRQSEELVGFSRIIQKHWYECENAHSTILYIKQCAPRSLFPFSFSRGEKYFFFRATTTFQRRVTRGTLYRIEKLLVQAWTVKTVYTYRRSSLFRERPSTIPTTKLNSFRFW